jgi:hypothetical protein
MPRLIAEEVKKRKQKRERREYINEQITKCSAGDPIQLSDLIVNASSWGGSGLICLGHHHRELLDVGEKPTTWKLRVVRDEWGNTLGPGDVVLRKTQKKLTDADGQPYPPMEMSTAIQDGSYDERFIAVKRFHVDKKGCIECNFEDAVYFLNVWGLHSVTGRAMTRKLETSREPVNAPNGQQLHCHYWRFREVTKEQYASLPSINRREGPLRGIDDMEKIKKWNDEADIRKEIAAERRKQEIVDEAKKATGAK